MSNVNQTPLNAKDSDPTETQEWIEALENLVEVEGPKRAQFILTKLQEQKKDQHNVRLIGSGTILMEVIAATEILQDQYQIHSEIFSATSFNELSRDARRSRTRKSYQWRKESHRKPC